MYKDTIPDDKSEFNGSLENFSVLTQHQFKIAERDVSYNVFGMNTVAHIDERDEERRRWKTNNRSSRKYRVSDSKPVSSNN